MSVLRWAAIAGVVVAVALSAPQTGAFSTVSPDRSVTVAVADDEHAFLAIEGAPVSVAQNRSRIKPLLRVTNRFPTVVKLTATLAERSAGGGMRVNNVTGPGSLKVGASGSVRADLICANSTTNEQVAVTLRASGDGISMVANRTVEVGCV